nr:hypothetical protein [Oxalobacteraceae bacterium]
MPLMPNKERCCFVRARGRSWQKLRKAAETSSAQPYAAIPLRPSTLVTNPQLPSLARRGRQLCSCLRSRPQLPSGLYEAFPAQYRNVARFAAHHRQGVKFMQTQATHAEPTTMFDETELASRWKISVRTLQDWRRRKTGPQFVKLQGWAVRYPLQAVIDFEEQSSRVVS